MTENTCTISRFTYRRGKRPVFRCSCGRRMESANERGIRIRREAMEAEERAAAERKRRIRERMAKYGVRDASGKRITLNT